VPLKFQVPRKALLVRFLVSPWGKAFLLAFVLTVTIGLGVFTYYYQKYARIIEARLHAGVFANTSLLYAAPRPVVLGQEASLNDIAEYLRRCGYSESSNNRMGWFHLRPDAIEINPGADSYDSEGAVVKIRANHITQIISLRDQTERTQYMLEPELITNLFGRTREKRRIVHFNDIPQVMVNAVLAAEDKHFFQHSGFDPFGIMRALWVDVKERRRAMGGSTLTQQLAGTVWLGDVDRGWKRKLPEAMITLHLEQKLTKQQIFEYYANAVPLGQAGSFSIQGLGQGAEVYLGKDLANVNLQDAALLAGMINAPSRRNPFRHPDGAKARRNQILKAMREDGFITERQMEDAMAAPMKVTREEAESSDAPYFVDLVNDTLQNQFEGTDFLNTSYKVYTTLDMNLQRDAVAAVRAGLVETDTQWKKRNKKYGTEDFPWAQVALVCLDAETGEVKALVGGRSYGFSQLNHAVAKRQPGSSFKPFVYAAAFGTAIKEGAPQVITPATLIEDEPTTFWFDEKPYEPANHKNEYFGTIPIWFALAHSLNVPAVKTAEMVGYDQVALTARAAGLNVDIKPTPSIALGAYEVTPLEIAGAYTVFANGGDFIKTSFIKSIRDQHARPIYQSQMERKPALDPRVAYLVENTLEEVVHSGTGAAVRSRYNITYPVAGKTGTSRDGWFAGFSSKLICVVWVGFDDNRDFKLEGAHSALPIWAEFMKRAHQHREYKNVHAFDPPDGIVTAEIDAETGQLATPSCPKIRSQVFIAGTQPVEICHLHGAGRTMISGWETTGKPAPAVVPDNRPQVAAATPPAAQQQPGKTPRSIPVAPAPAPEQKKPERKGFFGRLKDIFK